MDTTEANGNLQKQQGKLKQNFAGLTGNVKLFKEGVRQETYGKFQINLSRTRRELQKILAAL